jgi:hypothetical protein
MFGNQSRDSRHFGFVPAVNLVGVVNHVFMVADSCQGLSSTAVITGVATPQHPEFHAPVVWTGACPDYWMTLLSVSSVFSTML